MSDVPADYRDRLNLREQVARIDEMISRIERQQEETRKFVSEQHKLSAEEQKLRSEARKLERDRGLAPWQATAITVASTGALIASVVSLARSMGWL
jgi:predicted  nucleic acid-binding Zn-ribbon protein